MYQVSIQLIIANGVDENFVSLTLGVLTRKPLFTQGSEKETNIKYLKESHCMTWIIIDLDKMYIKINSTNNGEV